MKPIVGAAVVEGGAHRAVAREYGASRSITASAERIQLNSALSERVYTAWQAEAWTGYERVGEIHYGFNLVANILSRIRVYAAAVVGADQPPMEAGRAVDEGEDGTHLISAQLAQDAEAAMNDFTGENFSSNVRAFSINLSVAGECLLVNLPVGKLGVDGVQPTEWGIYSTDEIQARPTGPMLVQMRGSSAQIALPKDTYIARIWRQNPRYSKEPDSSMIGVADPVEELLMLQRLVRSSTRSRLNAGLLFVPDGIVASTTTVSDAVPPDPDDPQDVGVPAVVDPGGVFLAELMDSMVTPVSDEGSASAVVPMLATGPSELAAGIKHVTFARASDEWLVNRSERALERILQGIDVPKEVVTGLANVKYSNAVQISDDLYKANIEPLALVFADALTAVYLRPILLSKGYTEAEIRRVVVWYDPSEIVTRPNASGDANDGYDRFLISPDAWRRVHGFGDTDKPSEAELALMLLTSKGQLPEDVTTSLLNIALPSILGKQREQNLNNSVVPFPTSANKLLQTAPANGVVPDDTAAPAPVPVAQ